MKLISANQFATDIESMRRNGQLEYVDAVVSWCEKNGVEVEYAASIIKKDPVLRSKLQVEAEDKNIVKKTNKLPF
jgi:hypothetical protein